jgi:very-short-patch-repair endonuclease
MSRFLEHKFKPRVSPYEKRVRKRLERRRIPFDAQKQITTKSGRRYQVDLFVPPKLVVEIGFVGIEDIQEDEDLKASGYNVLRFKNKEVKSDLAGVCDQIDRERRCIT